MRGIQKRLLVGVMILALGLTALVVPSVDVSATQTSADWMAEVDGETMLSSLSIPGTHDTCTQYVGMSYIFQCQDTGVSEQLENGYRYLDLRLVIEEKDEEQTLVISIIFRTVRQVDGPGPSIFIWRMCWRMSMSSWRNIPRRR